MEQRNIIEMRGITKHFASVTANENVDLDIRRGEILSLLGENGSGKTSLMNVLAGIYFPDAGHVYMDGREVVISSPHDAYELGIGMVHQHFKLVDVFTAAENIILGLPGSASLDLKQVEKDVAGICAQYGFEIDPRRKVYEMSVSEKQTIEIVKMLYRGAKLLILDEPTAVLTPQETEKLFSVLRAMKQNGHSIVIITHKLNEVLALSDRVTVLRKGMAVGTVNTADATELSLTELMVGEKVKLDIDRPINPQKATKLRVEHLETTDVEGRKLLSDINFEIYTGEILGVAGVSGSGQKELLECLAGLRPTTQGSLKYRYNQSSLKNKPEIDLNKMNPLFVRHLGIRIAYVPEDRLGMGLVASMGMTDNMLLRSYREGHGFLANRKQPRLLAERIIRDFGVVTPDTETPVGMMSGGNVQKVLLGREIASDPELLMVAYPVRGLDINSAYQIYAMLNEQKMNGCAVLCVGEDLDVLMALCDRILVMEAGHITGIVDAATVTKEQLGRLMSAAID